MIIGLTGAAFAGKDTVGLYLARAHNFSLFAFADPIRNGLMEMLYLPPSVFLPENKETVLATIGKSPRQLMQTLGTEWGRNLVCPTLWVDLMRQRIAAAEQCGDDVVLTDVRFKQEARLIESMGGELWRIERPNAATTAHHEHQSESEASRLHAHRTICNDGTLEQLFEAIDEKLGFCFEIAGETSI